MARGTAYRLYVWLMVFSGLVLALTLGATSVKIILAGRHFTQTILEENKGFLANSLRFTHETMMGTEQEAYDLLIQRALKSKFIRYLAFLDSRGQVLAESDPLEEFPSIVAHHFPELEEGKLLEQVGDTILICYRVSEILPPAEETDRPQHRGGGSHAGMRLPDTPEWFLVALDISSFQSHYREMVIQTTGVALALLLFGVLVILFFGIVQRYELAHLSIEKLRKIKRLLGHFVPDFAKRMIEKEPEKKGLLDKYIQDATILFLDVEGFTALLQQYPQEEINRTIEAYFSAYLDVIRKNGGDINETAGDGMMVIFLDPDPARHAARAVQAAGEIRLKTETLSKEARAGENALIPIRVNMGLQSGQVYLGSTKMRAQNGERWTFTASGEATIVAARLADHATGGRILLGQETARRIDGSVPLAAMGQVQLKNLPSPEEVHEALPGADRSSPTATGSLC